MTRRAWLAVAGIVVLAASPAARSVFTDVFPPEEFAARRARVMDRIGDGVAILQGSPEPPAETPFRQNNQFFYLTGVEAPRALVVLDGRARRTTVYLADNARRARAMGPVLQPGPEAARVTGMDAALPRADFADALAAILHDRRTIYTPFRPEVRGSGSAGDAAGFARANREDPWDGRPSREEAFISTIRAKNRGAEIRDLDPIVDELRFIKSPREIAVIREATKITGDAIVEVMRDARPGLFEYELQAVAEYVFKKHGAQGPAYFALIATGPNTIYTHYHENTARLADGDLVQYDYAPDYKYYVSDITRVFPASGRFTPRQREFYGVYLRLYEALVTSMRPRVSPHEIVSEASGKMGDIMAAYRFTDAAIKTAAQAFTNRYLRLAQGGPDQPRSLGHSIDMEVHGVGRPPATLQPGQVFTIEPAMRIEEDSIGIRLEDVFLVTETGVENLSAWVPITIDEVEKTMAEKGMSERRN